MVSFRFSQEVGSYVEHVGMVQNLVGIEFQAPGGDRMLYNTQHTCIQYGSLIR